MTLLDAPQTPESQPAASLEQLLWRLDPDLFKAHWLLPKYSAESLQGEPHTGSVSITGPCLTWNHRDAVFPLQMHLELLTLVCAKLNGSYLNVVTHMIPGVTFHPLYTLPLRSSMKSAPVLWTLDLSRAHRIVLRFRL